MLAADYVGLRTIKNVHYLPAVSQNILQHHIKESNLIIIPYVALDINQLLCAPNRLFDALSTETPLLINKRIESVSRLIHQFGVGHACEMRNPKEIATGILHVVKNEDHYRTAYQNHEGQLDFLYSFKSQARVIQEISRKLKERLSSFISRVTFDMNLERIIDDLSNGDHQSAIQKVEDFVQNNPRLEESKEMLSLIDK